MDPAEVLAVKIPQYVGKNQRGGPKGYRAYAKAEAAREEFQEWDFKSFIDDSKDRIQNQYAYEL
jgi:hypothetical protein